MDSHGGRDKKTLRKVKQRIQKRRQKRSKQKLQRRTKRKQRITKRKINKKGGGENESEKTVEIKIIDSETLASSGFRESDNNELVIINIYKIYETDIFDKLVKYKLKTLGKYKLKDIHFKITIGDPSGKMPETESYSHILGIKNLVEKMGIEELKLIPPL